MKAIPRQSPVLVTRRVSDINGFHASIPRHCDAKPAAGRGGRLDWSGPQNPIYSVVPIMFVSVSMVIVVVVVAISVAIISISVAATLPVLFVLRLTSSSGDQGGHTEN